MKQERFFSSSNSLWVEYYLCSSPPFHHFHHQHSQHHTENVSIAEFKFSACGFPIALTTFVGHTSFMTLLFPLSPPLQRYNKSFVSRWWEFAWRKAPKQTCDPPCHVTKLISNSAIAIWMWLSINLPRNDTVVPICACFFRTSFRRGCVTKSKELVLSPQPNRVLSHTDQHMCSNQPNTHICMKQI